MQEPSWLTLRVAERIALMEQALGGASFGLGVVMTTLTDPPEGSSREETERWERTCDNCRTYCPDDSEFYTGTVARTLAGAQVIIAFGACPKCAKGDE